MSLLLDTYALRWLCEGNRRLGVRARAAIREGAYVSAIVTWEIAIKAEGHFRAPTVTRSTEPWSRRPAANPWCW